MAGDGSDRIYGASLFDASGDLGDTIDAGPGNDRIVSEGGRSVIGGKGGDDLIVGGRNGDTIRGGPGADTIRGEGGNDRLFGNGGEDLLDGGAGNDSQTPATAFATVSSGARAGTGPLRMGSTSCSVARSGASPAAAKAADPSTSHPRPGLG